MQTLAETLRERTKNAIKLDGTKILTDSIDEIIKLMIDAADHGEDSVYIEFRNLTSPETIIEGEVYKIFIYREIITEMVRYLRSEGLKIENLRMGVYTVSW